MPRRYIPTDYAEEMLDAIAEMTGHFAVDAWAGMTDAQRHAVDHPLWVLCDMYNDGVFDDFETDRIVVDYMGKRHETERPSQTALVDAIESIYNKYVRKVIYGNGPRKHIDFDLSDFYDENGNLK